MAGGYDNRDGHIWMDGKMVDWREANVHILTHAMHYASSVFEGERAYNAKIFKSREHSERLKRSAEMIDFEIPYTIDEIEAAKAEVLAASGLCAQLLGAVWAKTWASPLPATRCAWPSRHGNGVPITVTPR